MDDVIQVIIQVLSDLTELLLCTDSVKNFDETFRLDGLVLDVLAIILAKEEADVLSNCVLNPYICGVFGTNHQRAVHGEFDRLGGACLSAWHGKLVVDVKAWDEEAFLSVVVTKHQH
jgi:hypothetical protein